MGRRRYPVELKDRAVRLAVDARRDPETRRGAIARIAEQLGVSRESLRCWVRDAESAFDTPAGVDVTADNARLRRENAELRRANEILKQASAFFAAELDRAGSI